jgi:hypothetical protein
MRIARRKKIIAAFFLFIFSLQLLLPNVSYALTNGPAQPEMQKFEPAGTSDLVDLFTGDMKYNIPLLDVGGYPVNLSYHSGTGMEDEASWVGTGWTLNPGAMNRTMRGLPDDFDGAQGDKITKEYSIKEFKKVGAQLVIKPSLFGWEKGSKNSLKLNVYKDNYYGIGASIGASIGFDLAKNEASTLTAGVSVDVSSDVRQGLSISPTLSLQRSYDMMEDDGTKWNLSGGFSYNTRAGLKDISLSASFNTHMYANNLPPNIEKSATKYFGQSYTPEINTNTQNSGFTLSVDLGPSIFGVYAGLGGSGYGYKESNLEPNVSIPAYGYMNYVKARTDPGALLDFNREKDGVFLTSAPAIPVPVATNDFFVATSQTGSQQFRPYFGGNYVAFDRIHTNVNNNTSIGLTIGGGNFFKAGARVDLTNGGTTTGKWVNNNGYLNSAEAAVNTNIDAETVYFKQVGEPTVTDKNFYDRFLNTDVGKIAIGGNAGGAVSTTSYKTRNATTALPAIVKDHREKRNYGFSYLTNVQAMSYGLDKKIGGLDRNADAYRLDHHMSEITVTDNEGKRMVYGIPQYNITQEEATFSVQAPTGNILKQARRTGLVSYNSNDASSNNRNGREWLYSKTTTPGYATSFLLTGILSPDYVDVTGDGITDDDLGTAVKFNYGRYTNTYKWRAPYAANTANFNEGFLSDPKDDKANFVYGQKEIWYLQSIESKTMIAIFTLSAREDGLGVLGNAGGMNNQLKLQKLDKITLYSKADWIKNATNAIPVKVVHFEYDYSLYPGVENNSGAVVNIPDPANPNNTINLNAEKGKLTLKKVYFTFGKNTRGKSNPFEFYYDITPVNDGSISSLPQPVPTTGSATDPLKLEKDEKYTQRQDDRWGTYKPSWYNHLMGSGNTTSTMNNSEYPYSLQKNSPPPGVNIDDWAKFIDRLASKWQLIKIVTPSSGIITVDYESDDYAYVQDRKAMQMYFIKGIDQAAPAGQTVIPGLINRNKSGVKKLVIDLPITVTSISDFEKKFMTNPDGRLQDKLFYKIYTDINNSNKFEYVYGYAPINWAASTASGHTASIAINKSEDDDYNSIVKAAWQMLRTDLPQFAYDNYDNSDASGFFDDFVATIRSIISSLGNLSELFKSFGERADKRSYADRIDITKSMVRLQTPTIDGGTTLKTGGGSRVKKVQITDEWNAMTNGTSGNTAKYGQVYDYTTKTSDGHVISSGVASYEPSIGNEENPFHEPIDFVEQVHWSTDRYHYIEKPFCETYFPAASVGYSNVTVTSFGDDYNGSNLEDHTGYIENAFYTAKDFPTLVDYLSLDQDNYQNSLIVQLFSSQSVKRVATSQGFKVELNDMHGKARYVKVFDKSDKLISSSEYVYRTKDGGAQQKELDNDNIDLLEFHSPKDDPAVSNDGTITKGTLATDIDFVSDARESNNESTGTSIGAYVGSMIIPLVFIPLVIVYPAVNYNRSSNTDTYNSLSNVKVISRFGIVSKVITTQNGSTMEAENLLWDALTGEVLLTKSQNEFNKYTYAFSYPAYMVNEFEGMGQSYRNLGITFAGFNTGTNGKITTPGISDQFKYLFPGDELVSLGQTQMKGWIIKGGSPDPNIPNDQDFRLVDANGDFIVTNGPWMLVRSGRRNMLAAGVGTVITMDDPRDLQTNKIVLDVSKRILDSKAVVFNNEWGVPVSNEAVGTDDCSSLNPDCFRSFFVDAISSSLENAGTENVRRGFYSVASDNNTAATFINNFSPASSCLSNFASGQAASSFPFYLYTLRTTPQGSFQDYYIQAGDQAQFGDYKVTFTYVDPEFTTLSNSSLADNSLNTSLNGNTSGTNFYRYCIYPTGTCQYSFRELIDCNGGKNTSTNAGNINSGNKTELSFSCNTNPGCTYKNLLDFTLEKSGTSQFSCLDPVGRRINPYDKGILGNWRPLMNYVYTVSREQKPGNPNQNGGTDIRNSGDYTAYSAFWNWQSGVLQRTFSPTDVLPLNDPRSRWVWSNKSIYYDQKGNEIESVDALNRYGSALFGYSQSVATTIAANARHNEIAFDGFEDYGFDLLGTPVNCPPKRHLDWNFVKQSNQWISLNASGSNTGSIVSTISHTGKYSYAITNAVTLIKAAGNANPLTTSVLDHDNTGRYELLANEQAKGFAPVSGKKYLLSMWVNDADDDNNPAHNTIQGLQVKINDADQLISTKVVPVVEGWKRLELTFVASGSQFKLELIPTGTIYIDDVRLLPNDVEMNSYVYDAITLKLMAQLDENNFATLYEYDEEGTPVRVKKETEKGIMTLKESRQSLRNRN